MHVCIHTYVCIMVEWMWVLHVPYVSLKFSYAAFTWRQQDTVCTLENAQSCHSMHVFAFLAQTDRAVQLLLETEYTHPCYYSDSLKACHATAIGCNATSQSTVKLVSTNLIANGKLIGQFIWEWDLHVSSISHTFGCPLNGWQFPNSHTFPHYLW